MEQLKIARDPGSIPTWAVPFSDSNYTGRLSAGVSKSLAVPTGARFALVSANDWFFVDKSTITLPSGDFTATSGHLAKEIIDLQTNEDDPVTTLYFMARSDTDVSVSFYR